MLGLLSGFTLVSSIELIIAGIFIGIIASMVGIGGGLLTVPILILIFSRSAQMAGAISIVVIIFTSGSASIVNYRNKRIDFRTGLLFAVLVVPFSFLGGWIAGNIHNDEILKIAFGLLLLIVALDRIRKLVITMKKNGNSTPQAQPLDQPAETEKAGIETTEVNETHSLFPQSVEHRHLIDNDGTVFDYVIKMRWALIGAVVGGFIGGMLGLGGGVIFVPVLLAFGVPPHVVVATSSFIIIFTALAGSLSRVLSGQIYLNYIIPLAIGTVTGARFGAKYVKKISSQKVLILFYVILFLAGIRMILKASGVAI